MYAVAVYVSLKIYLFGFLELHRFVCIHKHLEKNTSYFFTGPFLVWMTIISILNYLFYEAFDAVNIMGCWICMIGYYALHDINVSTTWMIENTAGFKE